MTTVHASPSYRMAIRHPSPGDYPQEQVADAYTADFTHTNYETRRQQLLDHIRQNPAPNNTKMVAYELARLAAGGTPHEGVIHAALDYIDARKDCADFVLHNVLRMLYQFGDHPRLSPALLDRARRTVLDFKYWPDEPGVDSLCTWTENHHILFAAAAYLAGQLFPEVPFSNGGHTGRQKMALNAPRIRRWLDMRFRTGFSEWLSHVYYDEDLTAMLSLVDFCRDDDISRRATMVLDLLLLDMALNSYKGVFGSSHGRSYENSKKWVTDEGTIDTQKLLFGMGQYSGFDNMSAIAFALSDYEMPPVLAAIAQDLQRAEMENRQRMGIRLASMEKWGLRPDNFEDGMALLTLEAYVHPRTIALMMAMFDAFNWWQNEFFAPFKPYKRVLNALQRLRLLRPLARALEWDLCRNTREQVNILTYRTPDYMLSCAQDYRPGYGGDQQHIWQATLGANAVCFTTHPAKLEGASPNYWTGSGQLPRAAQVKNVVIAIYNLHKKPALYVPTRLFYTHAWLPQDHFNEVVEQDGWIFARKGEGYLGLYSQRPYLWQDGDREVVAPGRSNIWICELGRKAVDGAFADFVERLRLAPMRFEGTSVRYESPSQGKLEFGWQRPLRQNGRIIPLHDYPRYSNPYVQADFPAEEITVQHGEHALTLRWPAGERKQPPKPQGSPGKGGTPR